MTRNRGTILVADDDRAIRTVLTQALLREGHEVMAAGNAATLWKWVAQGRGDLVILDVMLPDEDGLEMVPRIRKIRPELRVVAMSARNTLMTAVRAAENGAFEYLPKPFDLDELVTVVERALSEPERGDEGLEEDGEDHLPMIGRSAAMQDVYRIMARVMHTDLTVMITGESGTGKELVARALHQLGPRKDNPFVAVSMGALPRELIERELFGVEEAGGGARSIGHFERAQGGTLFLDEVGDMPPEAQTRLLRVLQDGHLTRVGGHRLVRADVRILASTHRDLPRLLRQGRFREDLYYRLNVVPIRMPPLRERTEDITPLVRHFLCQAATRGLPLKYIDDAALDRLAEHDWPGNVRELENLCNRLAALHVQETITRPAIERELADIVPRPERPATASAAHAEGLSDAVLRHLRDYFAAHQGGMPAAGLYQRVLREIEYPLITTCLAATRGNQIKAARLLGLNRNTLRKKIRELEIEAGRQGR